MITNLLLLMLKLYDNFKQYVQTGGVEYDSPILEYHTPK